MAARHWPSLAITNHRRAMAAGHWPSQIIAGRSQPVTGHRKSSLGDGCSSLAIKRRQ
jgi:hypothetical protein